MKQILLVEDDSFLIDIYTTKFKEMGFNIDVAQDGNQALRKILENNVELVLLDIVLPHVDGWEILKKIRQENSLKDLKVVILSNLGQKSEVDKAFALGATKYLIKAHYTPSEVVEEIKKIL
ncbi:response regulator [Candidatus Parcubacteria bacterium]|nr:response regulator [Patescibacteria group bacterium]MBU4466917.1 response regulator [Patescibacteria group bacterium]MCG2688478.1 response regulator [Candidatus Parcubacteria bacterium]